MKKMRLLAGWILLVLLFSVFFACEKEIDPPKEDYTYTLIGEGTDAYLAISKYTGSKTSITVPSQHNGFPVKTIAAHCFSYSDTITNVTIPDSVTAISDYAFQNCTSLVFVAIPDNVEKIGQAAFAQCTSLKTIALPAGVTTISERLFDSSGLESLEISAAVTKIEKFAFGSCTKLKAITIPDTVKSVANNSFVGCTGLKDLTFGQAVLKTGFRHVFAADENDGGKIPQPEKIVITSGDVLARDTFTGCVNLKEIVFPDTMSEIGEMALMSCVSLQEVHLPASLKVLRESVFQNCESLEKLTLPEGLISIEVFSFSGCYALKEVVVPATVTSVEYLAFEEPSLLKSLVFLCEENSVMASFAKEHGYIYKTA